jgi:hypothetical protein
VLGGGPEDVRDLSVAEASAMLKLAETIDIDDEPQAASPLIIERIGF